MTAKPWAYVAHKDGYWAGVSCAEGETLAAFVADFIRDGFTVEPVVSREAYLDMTAKMQPWTKSPAYKAKHAKASSSLPLFGEPA